MFCATEDNLLTYSTRIVAIRVAERSNLRLVLLELEYAISLRLARYINTAISYWWHVIIISLWRNWKTFLNFKRKVFDENCEQWDMVNDNYIFICFVAHTTKQTHNSNHFPSSRCWKNEGRTGKNLTMLKETVKSNNKWLKILWNKKCLKCNHLFVFRSVEQF
jgi:hypothetical protein